MRFSPNAAAKESEREREKDGEKKMMKREGERCRRRGMRGLLDDGRRRSTTTEKTADRFLRETRSERVNEQRVRERESKAAFTHASHQQIDRQSE